MEIDYRTLLNCIEDLLNDLSIKLKGIETSYEEIGQEDEQMTDWNTKELLWEDDEHTIPKYRKIYGHVPKAELSEEEKRQAYTIHKLEKELMKLIGKVAG